MEKQYVDLFPVAGVHVRVDPEKKVVVVHLPHIVGYGTPEQGERNDRAYALMPEQAAMLRDSLNDALYRITTSQ